MILFGQLMKQARESAGYTQSDLASRLEVSVQYISDVEHSRRPAPKYNTLFNLIKILDIKPIDAIAAAAYTERYRK